MFGQHGPVRRPSAASVATVLAVGGAALFVFVQLQPRLLFAATTPNGGDMGAHVWGPAFMRDHLLPHGRITGWAPDWYAGFAFPQFYFPLPSLLIVGLDLLVPYEVAFKLISVSGLVSLPVAAWAFGRLAGLRRPGPECLAVATVPFLFDRSFSIYGGNIASTLAGEYSYSIALSLALVFLGVLARGLETGRHRVLAGVLLALTLVSHVVPTFFAVAGALVLWALRPAVRRLGHTVTVGVLAGLLTAFWALPFVWRLPYTNDMGYEKITTYRANLVPHDLRWLVVLAGVGALASLARRCRVGTFLTVMAGLSAVAFRFAPQGKIWNPRLLPFWFLCLYLLAGLALASLAWAVVRLTSAERRDVVARVADVVTPVVVVAATLVFVALPLHLPILDRFPIQTADRSYIPDWARWNYNGYERKTSWPEHEAVIRTMTDVGRSVGCGRAHWEYEPELDQLGTPLALMLLPYWTDGCIGSMEGLYFESSATTPYHFLSASELSRRASRPQRNLPYADFDLSLGVRHLQLLGSRYYMAFTAEARAAAAQHPDLRLVASTGPYPVNYPSGSGERTWEIYEVAGAGLVTPLENEPVVMTGVGKGEKAWLDQSVDWFMDPARWGVHLAASGPDEWPRVPDGEAAPPVEATPPVQVSGVRAGDDRISFDVDRPGSPVLVKASYFPNWQASGARGPWRVSPNLMVVVPTERHVELHYGTTAVDWAGRLLTVLGVVAVVVLAVRDRRRTWPVAPPPAEEVDGAERPWWDPDLVGVPASVGAESEAEGHQPAHRAQAAPDDRRARRARLPHEHGDLGHPEAGPLGPEDDLGVEQVGAEPAPVDDGGERLPAHGLHPVGVRDPEPEPTAEHEGEH